MSNVNKQHLINLRDNLQDVAQAILDGKCVLWDTESSDGWVQTEQINLAYSRERYHIGEYSPK